MSGPYTTSPEPGRPEEWEVLEHAGTGTPGLLVVEWDNTKDQVRSNGPVVEGEDPVRPAP